MVKLQIFDLSMIAKPSFKAVVLSFFLAAAFFFNCCVSFGDFSSDSFSVDAPVRSTIAGSLGTAYITRAALAALGVEIATTALDFSSDDVARAMWFGGGSTLPPTFTYAQNLVDYLSRETIRIRPDSVSIGGVEYSDVWLPYDAADKFRTNAFDFITRYNLISHSNGTFVSGVGHSSDDIPMYNVNGVIRSQNYVLAPGQSFGDWMFVQRSYNPPYGMRWVPNDNNYGLGYTASVEVWYSLYNGYCMLNYIYNGSQHNLSAPAAYVSEPFDFTWVSGTITSDPLPTVDGLRLRVPSSYVAGLPEILDPESSTYQAELSSLISGVESAAHDGSLTDPAFEAFDPPAPGSGTIAEEPYSSLSGALNGIQSIINSISSSVSGIADSIVGADSTFFGNIVSALAAPFESVFAIFRSGVGIWRYVVSWVGTISAPFSWSLSALGSAGSYFLSPLYAAAAAAVVLAVYKKFGR